MYLYICNYKKINIRNDFNSFITVNERKKIDSYIKYTDRERSLIEIVLLKLLIYKHCKIPIKDIIIKKNVYGKPYLANNIEFKFNISHSNELIVIGLDMQNEIGVDVEFIKEINLESYIKILKENEIKEINKRKNKLSSFYEFWTIKESFFKEEGKGISIIDDNYEINIKKSSIVYKNKTILFTNLDYLKYKICVCSSKIDNLIVIELDNEKFDKLMYDEKMFAKTNFA